MKVEFLPNDCKVLDQGYQVAKQNDDGPLVHDNSSSGREFFM